MTSRRCFGAILRLETLDEAERFFRDLCTLDELRDMAQRWAVVRMLDAGMHYAEISRETGASTATITRIASWLNHGEGGYRAMLDKLDAGRAQARTPTRSRASDEPRACGWRSRTRAGSSSRPSRCSTTPASSSRSTTAASSRASRTTTLDILFVRTNDIIEFVGDGVADLGITGERPPERDRRRAAAHPLARLRPLPAGGRGPERHARTGPSRTWPASASRPPTRTPPAGSSRSAGIPVEIIPISGAVEVAPRLGLAEGDRRSRLDRLDARR